MLIVRAATRAVNLIALLAMAGVALVGCAPRDPILRSQLSRDDFTLLFSATISIRVALPGRQIREGSGFIATRDGWVLTSLHVVGSDPRGPILEYANGDRSSISEIYDWPTRDLAVIVPRHPPPLEPLRFGDSDRVEAGQMLFACGVPFGLGRIVTRGIVDGRSSFESPRYVVWDGIIADGLSYPGDSGGPVVNGAGRVVGLHLGSLSSQRRAVIPSTLIRRTLIEARVRAELLRRQRTQESASL
jgi:S1-C subfamily serine protease